METIKNQIIPIIFECLKNLQRDSSGSMIHYTEELQETANVIFRSIEHALKSRLEDKESDGAEEILETAPSIKYDEGCKWYPEKTVLRFMNDFTRQRLRSELIRFLNSIDTDSFLNMSSEEKLVDEYLSGYAT